MGNNVFFYTCLCLEFLAEMYPQYDVSLRGVTWAMCVGVINNITKDLRKKAENPSHLLEKVSLFFNSQSCFNLRLRLLVK